MKLIGVVANKEVYIKGILAYGNIKVNGKTPEKTFRSDWLKVSGIPIEITKTTSRPNINHRYELLEHAPGKGELPQVMPRDEVMEEGEEGCTWKEEFEHLRSLYELKSDPQEPKEVPVDFEYETVVEVEAPIKDTKFSYDVYGRWAHKGTHKLTERSIRNQELDEIVFPGVLLPLRPCTLSSKESYDIVRAHVKQNINPSVAKITSDYDFCFTVKKVIPLCETVTKRVEKLTPTGRSYKYKRYRDVFIKTRDVEVFEMTHSPKSYGSYTPIPGFKGETHEDLKNNIDKHLSDLMLSINEPLKDCPSCNGMGVILNDQAE